MIDIFAIFKYLCKYIHIHTVCNKIIHTLIVKYVAAIKQKTKLI